MKGRKKTRNNVHDTPMESQKGFKNNSVIFNVEILYYHGQVRTVSDNKLEHEMIVQMTFPKPGLAFFIIEYNLDQVYDLEEIFIKRVPSSYAMK